MKGHSPFDSLWADFTAKHDMTCCDQFVNNNNINYTYFHESLNHRKWIDHFLISTSLATSTANHEIVDIGDNTSDHLPIKFQLSCNISAAPEKTLAPPNPPSLKWEKCSDEQKNAYSTRLLDMLHQSPSVATVCNVAHCQHQDCVASLQREYDNLTTIITEADKALPRHKPGIQKHWWNDELTCGNKKGSHAPAILTMSDAV